MWTACLRRGLVAGGRGLLVVAEPAAAPPTIRYGFTNDDLELANTIDFAAVRAQAGRTPPSGKR